ncbi:hypothetical protein [uncultured Photobacterium sp.]|uniref:hypothetical protein n=1 Tax=uncultured Photobacterium sp. TaxID=173973 RepID=UPI0026105F18|nr:hypothetical protein [uncultured Photobacterium sp.]
MQKFLLTGCMLFATASAFAQKSYELPVTPIGETRVVSNDKNVDELMQQVVSNLPVEKQQKLGKFAPKDNPANFQPAVDSYGMQVQTADQRTTAPPQPTAFERMTQQMKSKFKPVQKYNLRAGENVTLPAAKFIMNSVKTNFREVEVRTSDPNVAIKVEGSYLYFTTQNDAPFGLIIHEKGVPETQVNLSVWPLNVLATMVEVNVRLDRKTRTKVASLHRDLEQDKLAQEARIRDKENELLIASDPKVSASPYEARINDLFSQVGGNATPKGFDLVMNVPTSAKYPCRFEAKSVTKQRLVSSRRIIDIVLVTNPHKRKVVLREEQCWIDDDVIATGILNKATLKPGEKTEVYVMRDRLYFERLQQRRQRPSLLN